MTSHLPLLGRRGRSIARASVAACAWMASVVGAMSALGQSGPESIAVPQPKATAAVEPVFPAPAQPVPPSGPVTSGQIDGGVPIDGPSVPAPMYVPDPADLGAFAAIPQALPSDFAPDWPRWFTGAAGLVMTRTLPGGTATMQPVPGVATLGTASANATWPGGIDLHFGRWMGDQQRQGIEAIYWGVYGLGTSATAGGGGIDAIPQAPGVTIGGSPAAAFLVDASSQQIARSDLVNDVEINWLFRATDRPEFQPRQRRTGLVWLAGFRFFELEDVLTQLSTSSSLPPSTTGANQSLLSVATNNNLWGAQVGLKGDWRIAERVRLTTVPKIMIAGNSITDTTQLSTAGGTGATFAGGQPVHVHSSLGVFSWLGSVDAGAAWDVSDRWTLSLGYRVVGVDNVAQADGQWPSTLAAPADVPPLSAGTFTVIHGGYAGFQGRW